MQTVIAILCFGLLLCVAPASAQTEHSLTVRIHTDVRPTLTPRSVEEVFDRASKLMSCNSCNVKFKLNGPVQSFTSAPSRINDAADLEAVHGVAAHVKVVQSINFCMGRYSSDGWIGCAWRPSGLPKTVIVTVQSVLRDLRHILWTHEFGHTKGLQHRVDDGLALMTPCTLKLRHRRITENECHCFLMESGSCPITGPDPDPEICCPTDPECTRGR